MNEATSPQLKDAHFDVCIIGAGIAGLSAAHALSAKGLNIAVLEKSRGPGGRMATRCIDGAQFNYGAPSFTIESADFLAWAQAAERNNGLKIAGNRASSGYYYATATADSSINLLARSTFTPAHFYTLTRATALTLVATNLWQVQYQVENAQGEILSTGSSHASKIVVALPAPQAAALLAPLPQPFVALASAAASAIYNPCWVAMFTLSTPSNIDTNPFGEAAIKATETQLAKCIRQATNSDTKGEQWVIHATTEWTKSHLNDTKEMVANTLITSFSKHYNNQEKIINSAVHRWLYSQPAATTASQAADLTDAAAHGLVCVGDWVQTAAITPTMCNIERAWMSGQRLTQTPYSLSRSAINLFEEPADPPFYRRRL